MPPTHLPLYWQLPVLREAEGKFAEDSAMEESNGSTSPQITTPSLCPQLLPPRHTTARAPQLGLAHHRAYKDEIPRLLVLKRQHQPLIPFPPPLWASHPARLRLEREA